MLALDRVERRRRFFRGDTRLRGDVRRSERLREVRTKCTRELTFRHQIPVGEHARALDDVFQLAHVAVPARVEEQALGRRRQARQRFPHPLGGVAQKCRRQIRNIFTALRQRRQDDLDNVQPVEEVAAKTSGSDLRTKIAIGRRDDGDIDALELQRADALDFSIFERAQQLRLDGERELADFVEEEGSALSGLEHAGLGVDGAGEGAAHVAEQLALEKRVDDRGAVNRDEWPAPPRPRLVERTRAQLLAGSRLAGNQHDLRVWRQTLDQTEHFLHRGTASEHPAEFELAGDLAFECDDLRAPLDLDARLDEHSTQPVEIKGLGEILARPELDGFDCAVDGRVSGHQNHFAAGHRAANLPQQIEAVHIGHAQVDHREVGRPPHQDAHRFRAAAARHHVVAGLAGHTLDHFQNGRLVVDDDQQRFCGYRIRQRHHPRGRAR